MSLGILLRCCVVPMTTSEFSLCLQSTFGGFAWFQFGGQLLAPELAAGLEDGLLEIGVRRDQEVKFVGLGWVVEGGEAVAAMMRTVGLGSSAASWGLLPSLRLHRFPAALRGVQCCADVHAMKLVEKEYAELELNSIQHQVGGVRVRQHVNPFKASLTAPTVPPAWENKFADPMLPLHVDIGCGSGRMLMVLAKRSVGSCNFLGIDIRDKLVTRVPSHAGIAELLQRSTVWAEELSLTNIHFMVANATLALDAILLKYPGPLRLVSILCPDPHFKQRHRKRRIVQQSLVAALEKHLPTGGQVFLQSDVEEVAKDMRDQFDENASFARVHLPGSATCDSEGWLLDSPLGVATEREIHALANGGRIFRLLFQRVPSATA